MILKYLLKEAELVKHNFSDMFFSDRDNSIYTNFMEDINKSNTYFILQELNTTQENLLIKIYSKSQK